MQANLDRMRQIIAALLRGDLSVDDAASEIAAMGLAKNFAVGGNILNDPTSFDARKLQELAWKVARLSNSGAR